MQKKCPVLLQTGWLGMKKKHLLLRQLKQRKNKKYVSSTKRKRMNYSQPWLNDPSLVFESLRCPEVSNVEFLSIASFERHLFKTASKKSQSIKLTVST